MLTVNYTTMRNNFKTYCDAITNGEIVIVTRKGEKDVVLMSLENYNAMMEGARNAEYLSKIDFQ